MADHVSCPAFRLPADQDNTTYPRYASLKRAADVGPNGRILASDRIDTHATTNRWRVSRRIRALLTELISQGANLAVVSGGGCDPNDFSPANAETEIVRSCGGLVVHTVHLQLNISEVYCEDIS